jgi:small subunit ribosomal protein S3
VVRPRVADYAKLLHEDLRLRRFLKQRLYHAGISKIEIERAANKAKINIYTARPVSSSARRAQRSRS